MAASGSHDNERREQLLPELLKTLTPREREVFQLILEAQTSREIASVLRIART